MTRHHKLFGCIVYFIFHRQKFKLFADFCKHIAHGKDLIPCPPVSTEGHKFNKTYLNGNMLGPANEISYFMFVKSFHYDDIYLHLEAVMQEQFNIAAYPMKEIPAGYQQKFIRLQCVETDINGLHARGFL